VPIDYDAIPDDAPGDNEGKYAKSSGDGGGGKWSKLWEQQPEGGGAFGGRDNALTSLVGFLRAKSFSFEAARFIASHWNQNYCFPPLPDHEVMEKIGRKWYEWREGGHEDETPEDFEQEKKPEAEAWVFKSAKYLLDFVAHGGGLKWFVKNVFVENGHHYVSAPAAGAKSWLLIDLAVAAATGRQWLNLDVPHVPVLYIDAELGEGQFSTRFQKLGAVEDALFFYLDEDVKLDRKGDAVKLINFMVDNGIKLLLIDTFSRVWTGDENDNRQIRAFGEVIKAIRKKTGATVIIAHHDRKSKTEESAVAHEKMRGGGDIGAQCDFAYGLAKRGGLFHVFVTKNRSVPESDELNVHFELKDNEDKTRIELRILDPNERSERILTEMEQRILQVMEDGPLTTTGLAERVEGKKSVVIAAAKRLYENDELEQQRRGNAVLYGLPGAFDDEK